MTDILFDLQTPPAGAPVPVGGTQDSPAVGEAATAATAGPVLAFTVVGLPAPQGSKRGYVNRHTGRVAMVESSKRVKPWREAVKHAALDAMATQAFTAAVPLTGPLCVSIVYTLPRPKSHYRTGRNAHLLRDNAPAWPTGKPDVGKLTRASEDAMTDAGTWGDDAQIVTSVSTKSYPNGHPRALRTPGAHIRISRMGEPE